MPTNKIIKQKCYKCGGTGEVTFYPSPWVDLEGHPIPTSQISCPECGGEGKVVWGELDQRCPTYLILENTDSDEYTALNATKKDAYNLFISAGILDMSVGTTARDLFLAWIFPPGTKSYTAILAALNAL